MAALQTIAETIAIGEVSIYLSGNDNATGVLWGKRLNSPYSPVQIATCTDALKWQYEDLLANGQVADDDTLRGTANYLIWMCGKYGLQAQYIISGSGGGTVQPSGSSTRPQPLDFIVSASSIIPTGGSGLTIPSYVGWNLDFFRNNIPQNTTDRGDGSSYYTWNRTTATVFFSPALNADEIVRLTPV
jgi:hypothetical protein